MEMSAPAEKSTQFHADRPTDLRRSPPWHPLAYIIWLLPRRLRSLAGRLRVPDHGRVLDYGCAEQPYRAFFGSGVEFIGADLPGNPWASVTISPDGTVPLDDGSVDAILSTQVLEHVADPAVYLRECERVLRPGGRMLLSTHGMMIYHPDPVDYWRWTGAGLQRAIEDAGLNVVYGEGVMGLTAVGLQLTQDSLYHRLPRRARPVLALCFQTVIAVSDRFGRRPGVGLVGQNALVLAAVAEKPVAEKPVGAAGS
jgi:SAM-dependent methyltransferase